MSSYSPNPTAAAQPAVTVRRSRRRIGILALLAIGTMINYLDRTVLGIAAPKLTAELGIDPAIMGILFSAFAWPQRKLRQVNTVSLMILTTNHAQVFNVQHQGIISSGMGYTRSRGSLPCASSTQGSTSALYF